MHFRGKAGCSELKLSKRVMTGPLPPSAAKHDAIYKQNRPPSLSCAYACERFCIRSGCGQREKDMIYQELSLTWLQCWLWQDGATITTRQNTQTAENYSKKKACRLSHGRFAEQKTGGLQQQRMISGAIAAQPQLPERNWNILSVIGKHFGGLLVLLWDEVCIFESHTVCLINNQGKEWWDLGSSTLGNISLQRASCRLVSTSWLETTGKYMYIFYPSLWPPGAW